MGMRVEPVEKVCPDLVFALKVTGWYTQFVREVLG